MKRSVIRGDRILVSKTLILSAAGLVSGVSYIFHWNLIPFSVDLSYLYFILAIYGSVAFLLFRMSGKGVKQRVPWHDWLMFLSVLAGGIYLSWHGLEIVEKGWSMAPPVPERLASE